MKNLWKTIMRWLRAIRRFFSPEKPFVPTETKETIEAPLPKVVVLPSANNSRHAKRIDAPLERNPRHTKQVSEGEYSTKTRKGATA